MENEYEEIRKRVLKLEPKQYHVQVGLAKDSIQELQKILDPIEKYRYRWFSIIAKYQQLIGWCYWIISHTEAEEYNLELSIKSYSSALKFAEKSNQLKLLSSINDNLGTSFAALAHIRESLKHFQLALTHYKEAIRISKNATESINVRAFENNIGGLFWDMSQYFNAIENLGNAITQFEKVLALYDKDHDRKVYCQILNNLALSHQDLGQKKWNSEHCSKPK